MADYRILVGTELKTDGINTALKNYKGKVNVGATLDTSGITKAINGYKSKSISVDVKLNTDGITNAIRSYAPPKKIHLESDLSTVGIDQKIKNYTPSKPIKVDVELSKSSINQQIRDYKPSEHIKIDAKLDNSAITKAIRGYKAAAPIKIMVDPDFSEAGAKISNYQMRNMLKVNVKLNKTAIDKQIQNFQTSSKIEVGAKLRDNAIEKAIRTYAGKELVPVMIDFKVGDTKEVTNKINAYKTATVPISVKLQPAKTGFDSAVTAKSVKVHATLEPNDINKAIESFHPTSKIKVDVKLEPKDINGQIKKLPKPTDPLNVDVELNEASVNGAIAKITPTSRLNVGVDLKTDDINKQIESIRPTSKVKVNVNLDNSDIDEKTGKQNVQEPIQVNVKLNTEKLNEQIKSFKTQSKVSVGVKLDFASHKDGQKGVPQQIKDYKTSAKIKVGVELDKDDITQQIGQVNTSTPIKLGVELDQRGIQRVQKQIDNFREQIKALGNVRINLGGMAGAGSTSGKSNGGRTSVAQGFIEADIKIDDMANHIKGLQSALKQIGFNKSSIDSITKEFEELDVVVKSVTTRLDKNKNLSLSIKGLDEYGRAVKAMYNIDANGKATSLGTSISQSFKETEAAYARLKVVANQMKSLKVTLAGLDAEKDKQRIAELTSQLNKLQSEYSDLFTITRQNLNTSQLDELRRKSVETGNAVRAAKAAMADKAAYNKEQAEIRETRDEYQKLIKIANSMQRIKVTLAGLDAEKDKNRIAELTSQLKILQSEYRNLFVSNRSKFDTSQLEALKQKSIETGNAVRAAKSAVADNADNLAKSIRDGFGSYDAKVKSLETDIRSIVAPTKEVRNAFKNLNQALIDMKNASNNDELIEAENRYQRELKETQSQLLINQSIEKQDGGTGYENFAIKKEAALIRISNLFEDGSQAAKRFGAEARRLTQELNNVGSNSGVDKVNAQIANLEKQIKKSNLQTKTFGTRLKDQFSKYSQYLSIASLFMYAAQGLRSMFEQVKLIDSAMTELKKVTDETDATYNKFLSNAATRAREIGTTIDGLVSSTADFARLGYGFEDAQGLAEVANIYAVVGDEIEGVEGATESLISTMAAFKDQASGMSNTDFAMSIIDKFNEIGNNFAISSGGIGEALERSASSLDAANNTIDESIALITAANTVVQNPEKVGNAFKTISMRIRGAKTELEEAGESTEGMAESTAIMRQEIMALSGVDIMLNNDTFKSTYQIMDELSQKWEDLSDIAQASIVELMAGKHQGNVFASLMANFDTARDALETSLNSSGSAMKEHEKWSQSLEAQLLKLKASWQGLSQAFLKSDFLKVALDFVIGLVDGITLLIDKVGVLPTLFTGFSIFKSFGNKGLFKTFNNDLDGFTNKVGIANHSFAELMNSFKSANTGGFKGFISGLSSIKNSLSTTLTEADLSNIEAYNDLIDQGVTSQTAWYRTMQSSSDAAQGLVQAANGGKVALNGMKTATIGAKVGLIGAKVAAVAFNAALTMGISLLIDFAISGISKLINAKKDLAEKVEEVTSKFREQQTELQKLKGDFDATNADSMISKYGRLSKGVNELGENVSLTADEYSEYQSIVDTIASKFPELVTGYNSQGDAILSCKGSVEELTQAYRDLILEQNNAVLDTGKDIFKDFKNDINKSKRESSAGNDPATLSATGHLDALQKIFKSEDLESAVNSIGIVDAERISALLEKNGFKRDVLFTGEKGVEDYRQFIIRAIQEDAGAVKKALSGAYDDINTYAEELGTATEAYFSTAFLGGDGDIGDYSHFSERMQNVINQVTSGFDSEFYEQFLDDENPYKSLTNYYDSMLKAFDSFSSADTKEFEAAFNLKTQFNSGDISYGEYVKSLEDAGKLIDGLNLDEEVKTQIKLSLGLNEDGIVEEYESLNKRLVEITTKDLESLGHFSGASDALNAAKEDVEKFLNTLSSNELSVVTDIIPELDAGATIEEIQAAINREMAVQGLTFDLNLEVEATGMEALNAAMAESVSATGLSSESIAALKSRYADLEAEGYNLSAMFEETSNGIHINRKAVKELEQAYAESKQKEIKKDLKALETEYENITKDIENCNDASKRASLYVQRDAILQQINDAATLAAQYDGLTSAYNEWLAAEEAGQERDMYEGIIEGFEAVKDEISRGWLDDGTREFLELLYGEKTTITEIVDGKKVKKEIDIATASASELKQAYKELDQTIQHTAEGGHKGYSISDFFTVDEDGNSTSQGVYNFLDAIGHMEEEMFGGKDVVKRDKNGKIIEFDFKVAGGEKAIADALGISEELVQIMLRAADDAGFVVNLEGAYTQLADLKTEAETARDTLISLKKDGLEKLKDVDVNFDLNAEGNDLLKEQEKAVNLLDKFRKKDGTINMELKGAQQALDIAEYLTIRLDDLTEPKYMEIDVSAVEEDLQEPIEQMQEFERLSKEKHLLTLTGDKEGLKKVNAEMDEIAENLFAIEDKEVKAKIGIDGLSEEEIKEKLEKGEIEIDAGISLELEMSDDLKDMRLMMMNQLGLASDEEVKLKVGFDIDESLVDSLDDEQKKIVVEYVTKNKEEFDKLTEEEKEVVVNLVADGVDLDKYKPEDKEAIVNYIANGEEADGWTPEAKDAFVKYLVDGGEPDKFDPENKDSWVVYDTDTSKPDGYDPDDPTATVTYNKDSTDVDNYNPPNYERTVTFWAKVKKVASNLWGYITGNKGSTRNDSNGYSDVNGTANVNGTAFVNGTTGRAYKKGDWGVKKTETALTGELGRELVVIGNRWYTVGDNGAEFATIPKGAIVFNHRQTEELFANGKVTSNGGRGKVYANGTAHAQGTAFEYGSSGSGGGIEPEVKSYTIEADSVNIDAETSTTETTSSASKNSSTGKTYDKNSSDEKEEFEETIDWVEIAISRIERAIDNLDRKANNVYKSWTSRNKALTDQISEVGDEINLQQQAYDEYMAAANGVGLDEYWAKKVRDGTIDIETIEDEVLAEKIKDYETLYEKALDCKDAIEELREEEARLYAQRFENVQAQYDGILQGYDHTEAMLNEYISQAEEQGHIISKKYYNALIDNEKQSIAELKDEQSDLLAKRQEYYDAMRAQGMTDEEIRNSEEWIGMSNDIDDVTQAIEKGETAIHSYAKAMREIDWETFDLKQKGISDVTDESDFMIDLMSNEDLHDDNGKLTAQGAATLGLHGLNYNTYMYQADEYGKEIADIDEQLAKDPNNKELINRKRELVGLQREAILAAEDEKQAIKDLVQDGIDKELDALQELIDKKNEELESAKNLYEYQKKVKKQTEEIASIEKQMAAYKDDNSEEARAKIQELKLSLEDAKENLKETEWDKYIQDTSELFDSLYTEYETILNTRLDNIDYLLEQVIDGINASMCEGGVIDSALGSEGAIASAIVSAVGENGSIKSILSSELSAVGTTLSTAMNGIWSVGEGNAKSVLTMYGDGFQAKQTTTNTVLNGIKVSVDKMASASDKEAQEKTTANKTTTSAKKDPTKDATAKNTATTTNKNNNANKSSGDGNAKVGDKVKFVSGKYYYDSQGAKPLGSWHQGENVYITSINTASWATHPYHISTGKKLGEGDLGWLKLNQLSGYAAGKKKVSNSQYAWTQENGQEFIVRPSDGAILTPVAKSDSILNAVASGNIWKMANSPAEFIRDNLKLDAANVPNGVNVNNTYSQHIDNVVFRMDNIKNYEEMLSAMQKDKNFERLILSMSIDRLAGKSGLAKGKSIR